MNDIPIKIAILKFVAEQGVVTVDDVMRKFGRWSSSDPVRMTMTQVGITHQKFGSVKHGLWFIDKPELFALLRRYYRDIPKFKVRGMRLLLKVPHSLGVNHIRIGFEKSSKIKVVDWWSEEYIRALPPGKRDGITAHKIPDAIFWHQRKDGTHSKFFLEYERSLKAPHRYGKIFQFYDKRVDVKNKNVIYVCETEFVRDKLIAIEQALAKGGKIKGTGLNFTFITLDEFNRAYSEAKQSKEEDDEKL
ncbi:MAG TPA: hypothetical protein PLB05_02950 [Candidatus Omnitrophota bacterium]|nr:hypothetical protein [Candidatus Omnitrophota bacterium]